MLSNDLCLSPVRVWKLTLEQVNIPPEAPCLPRGATREVDNGIMVVES